MKTVKRFRISCSRFLAWSRSLWRRQHLLVGACHLRWSVSKPSYLLCKCLSLKFLQSSLPSISQKSLSRLFLSTRNKSPWLSQPASFSLTARKARNRRKALLQMNQVTRAPISSRSRKCRTLAKGNKRRNSSRPATRFLSSHLSSSPTTLTRQRPNNL